MPIHDDEVRATVEQVRRLVADQRPEWADLPVTPVPEDLEGTDHVLFRVGDALVARMPKIAGAADQADSDARWLPMLASRLPVRIPVPLHVGEPGAGYPWRWTVAPWVPGTTPPRLGCDDVALARELAAFVRALHLVDPADGPVKPPGSRGSALRHADEGVRRVLPRLAGHDDGFDLDAAKAAWGACLATPDWDRAPVWIHGDLQPGNLITNGSRLTAVIDFGALGIGDPAPDVAPALWTFTGAARDAYREAVGYDDATWRRACGWALAPSLTGIDYYRNTFPRMAEHGRRMARAVIAELT
ncbi:aminoglycoside phosphotransferase family protein [Actinoplanes sp. NEAU-A12]|uniref:Aminoglycoside phosphotransferase family protein n=1 Tax=Actinoplanes sandaracinus TaxID=3045177 RepID=A0ABT6WKJ2_9ACTN|nr:aminoglycoside phosphotransferase family protein [Actinoplanes sandaracinus]MDI6100253.1 aminoglycoside phosphotransferase family protein [Actinoplanes sandaracinus]